MVEERKYQQMPVNPLVYDSPDGYTALAITNRWAEQRNAWLATKNPGKSV